MHKIMPQNTMQYAAFMQDQALSPCDLIILR